MMSGLRSVEPLLLMIMALGYSQAFSIPGVSLLSFKNATEIKVYANELDSTETLLPFEYYYLNYCPPLNAETQNENLGSMILGETTQNTPYNILMGIDEYCKVLCKRRFEAPHIEDFKWMIERNYRANFVIDNLPALYPKKSEEKWNPGTTLEVGVPLGFIKENMFYLYNHLRIIISTFAVDDQHYRIVGFTIEPHSFNYSQQETGENFKSGCNQVEKDLGNMPLTPGQVIFTYDVVFQNSNKSLASRWDDYKFLGDESIHWFSILSSFVIIIFLTGIIAHILRKSLRNDLKAYNEVKTTSVVDDSVIEDSSWKQLSRDVFRPPGRPLLMAVLVGAGVQVGAMIFLTLFFVGLGFMNQTYRGNLLTLMLLLFVFMGVFAGYYSARLYKLFNGIYWFRCTFMTAIAFPGVSFSIFFLVNMFLQAEKSSGAVSYTTFFALFAIWFGISVPLVFIGGFIGFRKKTLKNPCKAHPFPNPIDPQPWYLNAYICCFFGGLLPFGAVFIELVFIMMSIWRHSFYYLFAFLFLVIIVLIIISAEISIVITYLQLCNGNYKWWWRSFLSTGATGFYVFGYAIFHFMTQLEITRFSSSVLYFGYMFVISYTFFIFCGAIGFLSSFIFVRTIYSMIKVD